MSFIAQRRYTYMTQLLRNKNAIIYGAGGGIGRGDGHDVRREGAGVSGRPYPCAVGRGRHDVAEAGGKRTWRRSMCLTRPPSKRTSPMSSPGSAASTCHSTSVTRGDVQGQPLLDISMADLTRPVTNGLRANAITARAAARHMVGQGSGVILHLTSGSSAGLAPMMGGTGPPMRD